MTIGEMRERATLQQIVTGTWTDIATTWARVDPKSGIIARTAFGESQRRFTVTVRYRSTFDLAARFIWRGKTLEIVDNRNEDEHRGYLTLEVQESASTAVDRLITRTGVAAILRRVTNGTPADASKPWTPGTATTVDITTQAVVQSYEAQFIDNTTIAAGDERVMIVTTGAAFQPQPGDYVVIDSRIRSVLAVKLVSPGDPIIAYELQTRGQTR